MGYKRSKVVKLTWADGEFEGLEVRAQRVSVQTLLELGPLLDADLGAFTPAEVEAMRGLFLEFGRVALASWNLEDEDTDEPVPCTPEDFLRQDLALMKAIITAWAEHISGVAAPLERPSPGGDQSLEESLPMEVLSPSPAS